ncbi:hypothetical protein C0J50_23585 [Silurus asotus]|uniref:Uncharacterized protein n=1 Tax=Silurus asotus TaxID=30991 RepID=A0AAD5AHJ9_SILAS|nr:hypothetical protein C0J50_23585 [Silurus asotus]
MIGEEQQNVYLVMILQWTSLFIPALCLSVAHQRAGCSPGGCDSHGGVCVQAAESSVTETVENEDLRRRTGGSERQMDDLTLLRYVVQNGVCGKSALLYNHGGSDDERQHRKRLFELRHLLVTEEHVGERGKKVGLILNLTVMDLHTGSEGVSEGIAYKPFTRRGTVVAFGIAVRVEAFEL